MTNSLYFTLGVELVKEEDKSGAFVQKEIKPEAMTPHVPAPYTLKINLSSRGGISICNVSHRLVDLSPGGISICNVLIDL